MAIKNIAQQATRRKWTEEDLRAEASKFSSRGQFQKKALGAYLAARKRGLLEDICSHMDQMRQDWTYEDLKKEALKYNTRSDFYKGSNKAHQAAGRRKILDEICAHMDSYKWTNDELHREALKFNTRGDFWRFSVNAYNAALDRGILGQICQHMTSKRRESDTVYLWRPENLSYYKVGVTTRLFGHLRMWQVADLMGVKPEMVLFVDHPKPFQAEKKILGLGIPVQFASSFDGSTEFRWMSPEDIQVVYKILKQ